MEVLHHLTPGRKHFGLDVLPLEASLEPKANQRFHLSPMPLPNEFSQNIPWALTGQKLPS